MLLVIGGLQLATHGSAVIGTVVGLAGIASMVALVRREKDSDAPVLPVDLLRRPAIGLSALSSMTAFIAAASLMIALPFRLELGMGYDPQEVGMLLLPFPLTMLVVSPLAGWMSDRIPATKLGVTGLAIVIVAMLVFAFMPDNPGKLAISLNLVLMAIGFGLFFAPNTRLLISSAPRDRAAAAGGVQSTARLTGQALAAVVVGILLAANLGMGPMPMFVACGFAAFAAGCALLRFRYRAAAA